MGEAANHTRTIRLVRSPAADGVGVFAITAGGRSHHYVVVELPCEIGGRGFAVHRLGLGTVYHVRVGDSADSTCECLGFLRWGRCKHVAGLRALIRSGAL